MKGIFFCLEGIPAGPPDGALTMRVSAQPGANLVAHKQMLHMLGGGRPKGLLQNTFWSESGTTITMPFLHPQRGLFSGNFLPGKLKITCPS